FPLHHANVLQPRYGVIPQLQWLFLDTGEPPFKTRKIKGILFTGVYQDDWARSLELSTTALSQNRDDRMWHGRSAHLPVQRRRNQWAAPLHRRSHQTAILSPLVKRLSFLVVSGNHLLQKILPM